MIDRYYKQSLNYAMRNFVYKILDKYVEYIRETNPIKADEINKVFSELRVWLYQTTLK